MSDRIEIYTYFGRIIKTFPDDGQLWVTQIELAREWALVNCKDLEWWLRIEG